MYAGKIKTIRQRATVIEFPLSCGMEGKEFTLTHQPTTCPRCLRASRFFSAKEGGGIVILRCRCCDTEVTRILARTVIF